MNASRRSVLRALFERVLLVLSDPARHRLLVLDLQEELIERTVRVERAIRCAREAVAAHRTNLREHRSDGAYVRRISRQIARLKETITANQSYLEILRTVGDALAFIFGDRFDLKPLAFREAPGFIGGKRGARLERAILRSAFAHGHVAILNDITHTLRHGDVTVFRPDGTFHLIEVKSGRGGKFARSQRQLEVMRTMATYLVTDERKEEGGVWRRFAVRSAPADHSAFVTERLQSLPDCGWSLSEVEPGLFYLLVDCLKGSFSPERALAGLDRTTQFEVLSANNMKYERMGYVPFPLLIRDPDILCRFYAGELVVNIFVSIDAANHLLAAHGLSVSLHGDPLQHWEVHDNAHPQYASFTSAHFVGRLAAEFVTLKWLVESIAASQTGLIAVFDEGADTADMTQK